MSNNKILYIKLVTLFSQMQVEDVVVTSFSTSDSNDEFTISDLDKTEITLNLINEAHNYYRNEQFDLLQAMAKEHDIK